MSQLQSQNPDRPAPPRQKSGLILPPDAQELMELAKELRPELRNFKFASDCITAQTEIDQYVHMLYHRLRKRLAEKKAAAGPSKPAA